MLNRYIIERNMKGVGSGSDTDYKTMASKSNEALNKLTPQIQWIKSFVTADKVYCEYLAENEDVVREHARLGGFPADSVSKVTHICDPTTAEDDFTELRTPKSSGRENTLNA